MMSFTTYVSRVRNVNVALRDLVELAQAPSLWRKVSPRGMETMEYKGTFITEYTHPTERVLFCQVRDANPFFHMMEALWILDGRNDVAFLSQFNSNISTFSDDGQTFNAPYGYRLRKHFARERGEETEYYGEKRTIITGYDNVDQLSELIDLLQREPDTRRAVLCLWDPVVDLNRDSKDIPCNDVVMFKMRDGVLDMTVCNRSNDAMWGAYGANAVQFSILQEFVATAVGASVGVYKQVSDSFHMYTNQSAWLRVNGMKGDKQMFSDPYKDLGPLKLVPLMSIETDWRDWLRQNHLFLREELARYDGRLDPFFFGVASPILHAWRVFKNEKFEPFKNNRIEAACDVLRQQCEAEDWALACIRWLSRRREA